MPSDKRFAATVPGAVIQIRLATEDIMRAIDAAEAYGLAEPGMSLAQACKWGIVKALWELEAQRAIPARDGFEYSQMVQKYESAGNKRKALVAQQVMKRELAMRAAELPRADGAEVERIAAELAAKHPDLAAVPRTDAQPRGPAASDDSDDSLFPRRPRELKLGMAAVAELNHRVMSTALASERANLTPRERALWLLNSDSAASWETFFDEQEFNDAASEVLTYWPAGAAALHALRDQPRSAAD